MCPYYVKTASLCVIHEQWRPRPFVSAWRLRFLEGYRVSLKLSLGTWPIHRAAMKDIASPGWIKFKGILFLMVGLASAGLLVMEHPQIKVGILLSIAVWCFCRFYY